MGTEPLVAERLNIEKKAAPSGIPEGRLLSLDFFRGFTMFMLVGEATGLYELLRHPALSGTLLGAIGLQLDHHPWNGLRCWDLVQPFFMFTIRSVLERTMFSQTTQPKSEWHSTKSICFWSGLVFTAETK